MTNEKRTYAVANYTATQRQHSTLQITPLLGDNIAHCKLHRYSETTWHTANYTATRGQHGTLPRPCFDTATQQGRYLEAE